MDLSIEELDFLKDVFSNENNECVSDSRNHKLTVQTAMPKNLSTILGNAKLTLLAEVSHYQLWFPLTMNFNDAGYFTSNIGTPEIIDIQGIERSWRVNTPKNVVIIDHGDEEGLEVLSLSSTGLTLKVACPHKAKLLLTQNAIEIKLPDKQQVKLEIEPVRADKDVIAAKFKNIEQGKDSLRKFLFNIHRTEFSSLYKRLKV